MSLFHDVKGECAEVSVSILFVVILFKLNCKVIHINRPVTDTDYEINYVTDMGSFVTFDKLIFINLTITDERL